MRILWWWIPENIFHSNGCLQENIAGQGYWLMNTEVDRHWYQSIHFDKLSCRQVSFFGLKVDTKVASLVHFDTVPTGWVSKHYSVGLIQLQSRHTYAVQDPLVMVSIYGRKRTVFQTGSFDIKSTFNGIFAWTSEKVGTIHLKRFLICQLFLRQ